MQEGLATNKSLCRFVLGLLKRELGSTPVIINSHKEFLYKLPLIRSSEDVKCIRELYDQIEVSLTNLEGIGVEPDPCALVFVC